MRALEEAADMAGHGFAVIEALDGVGGDAHIDLFADQLLGDAVIVGIGFDVIVDIDCGDFPFGIGVGLERKRFEGRFIKCFKQVLAAAGQLLESGGVEFGQKRGNGIIELPKARRNCWFLKRARIQRSTI